MNDTFSTTADSSQPPLRPAGEWSPQDGPHRTRGRAAARDAGATEREIDSYRTVLAAVVEHHAPAGEGLPVVCACGRRWPCPDEQRAAQLLDTL